MDGLPADAAQELAGLEAEMENPREWFHNHAGQERYRQLVEAENLAAAEANPLLLDTLDPKPENPKPDKD